MGCNRWLQVALLALLLSLSVVASAATRKQVTMPSPKSVSDNPGGSPTKSGGTLSIPGQPIGGEYIPGIQPGKGIKISPTPRIDYSIPKTITLGKNLLKGGGLAGLLLGPGLQGMLDSIGGLIDEGGDVVKIDNVVVPPSDLDDYYWQSGSSSLRGKYSDPSSGCSAWVSYLNSSSSVVFRQKGVTFISPTSVWCNTERQQSNGSWSTSGAVDVSFARGGSNCPADSTYNGSVGGCMAQAQVPLTETDWSNMATFAEGQSAEWLNGLIQDSCKGALDPAGCVADLKTASSLSGPSSVAGPTTTSTTTYTKPDGTTGTQTTTTTTNFSISYGSDYYDYSKTTMATTSTDGQQTSETTTTEDSSTEEDQQDQQDDYSFTDTDFPHVDPLYEQKYPDGLSGVWQARKTEVDNSAFLSFLRSFIPDFSGSCPSWGLSFDLGFVSFGTHQFESLCYVFDFVGTIILVTALFAARSITFGG